MSEACIFSSNIILAKKYPESYNLLKKHLEDCCLCQKEIEKIDRDESTWFEMIPCPAPSDIIKSAAQREIHELTKNLIKHSPSESKNKKLSVKGFILKKVLPFNR